MNRVYQTALRFSLKWEGEYVDHPNDPGGATMKGVTQGVYDQFRRRAGLATRWVKKISTDELMQIYRREYWAAARCDEMPALIAIAHFDWAVNTGVRRAIKHLQEAVGTKVDGYWGPNSRAALAGAVARQGELAVADRYMDRREQYYRALGARPRFRVFLDGWLNRLRDLRTLIQAEAINL